MSDSAERLKSFVVKCDDEGNYLYEAIKELEFNIDTLSSAIVDYNIENKYDLTPQVHLDLMKLKLAGMIEYAAVLEDLDYRYH